MTKGDFWLIAALFFCLGLFWGAWINRLAHQHTVRGLKEDIAHFTDVVRIQQHELDIREQQLGELVIGGPRENDNEEKVD